MPIKNFKLKQFAASLLAALSLFTSSVAACACSHHQEKPVAETPSCHEHAAEKETKETSEKFKTIFSETGCVCFQLSPKSVVKSENLKVEKHIAGIPAIQPVEVVFIQKTIRARIDFSKPLYLSDSFYNLSPGRAPPVL